ncbi:Putative Tetratricopeptide TPR_2 repeat protein [Methyloversatilis universalis FAM5]|uniref:Tetratricopeptide TPR_2 repeat protein n=1 Tax=Methyloversatilis universalis (strain ATCC BAA-1314 / DSM 25237 / JCM 13912 / CCUG 52030 / FAM5) TaxID=1000565 RepID=F5RDU2_METUF|nr:tetratricopeptide repeat protein [Methyloversatilis universalis]EGK71073.1 Putative Tetratricopeptide TPR_2 repeat protein [Methyloversatilis universalis FAM5]
MTHSVIKRWLFPALIVLAAAGLYAPYLDNPLVFDDEYFFMAGNPESYVAKGFSFAPRWLAYYSHGLTFTLIGTEIYPQRIGNMILHAGTGVALYAFILCLLSTVRTRRENGPSVELAAAIAALLFVLHPAAVYGAGYLIQRTILMATFFCLLSWVAFWKGINGSRTALWLATPLFMLAALSKEHVVMAPIIAALLWIGVRGDGMQRPCPSQREIIAALLSQAVVSLMLVLSMAKVIGHAYEPMVAGTVSPESAASTDSPLIFPLSVLTQSGLFFKYLILWIVPNGSWMSIDMREPFAALPVPATTWLRSLAFFAYPVAIVMAWLKYRRRFAIGIALLTPWVMFSTEIATVRVQEIFVLYRSYLWMPALFALAALGLLKLERRMCIALGVIGCCALGLFSINKLNTFSHTFYIWDEAASLAEQQGADERTPAGLARIYHNRGLSLMREGFIPNAIEDFNKALSLAPEYTAVYSDRGAAHLGMKAFDQAIEDFESAARLDPNEGKYRAGKAAALRGKEDTSNARLEDAAACALGWVRSCTSP